MQHPVQAFASVDTLLVTACNSTLTCFDLSTSTRTATASPHSALIRSLVTFTEPSTSNRYLISTGEDKQLVVSKLPSLEVVNRRELVKRANALDVTQGGEIVVGDKFGDVYTFPLQVPTLAADEQPAASSSESEKKKSQPEYLPILGHVSMLNALTLIDARNGDGTTKSYIATGDRDEHVRISRYPLGHVIEGFLWGSKHFVSSLLYLPPSASTSVSETDPKAAPLLLSAGGDPTIQIFKLNLPSSTTDGNAPVGALVGKFEIESLLLPHVKVAPVLPDPVPAGRKKDKKGKNKSTATTTDEGGDEIAPAPVDEEVIIKEGDEAENDEEKKELKTGLAVIKMIQVGTEREQGGILVLAAGSTALLYIPFSSLLSNLSGSAERSHSLLTFPHPILDVTPLPIPVASTSAAEFLLSFDTTRSSSPSSSSEATSPPSLPLLHVSLDQTNHELTLLPSSTPIDQLVTGTTNSQEPAAAEPSTTTTSPPAQPSIASLYPVLMMLHHPGDESDLIDGPLNNNKHDEGSSSIGDGKPKGGVRAHHHASSSSSSNPNSRKRTSSERLTEEGVPASEEERQEGGGDEEGSKARKNGKRAVGRAETLRRWEEAKKRLEMGGQGQP